MKQQPASARTAQWVNRVHGRTSFFERVLSKYGAVFPMRVHPMTLVFARRAGTSSVGRIVTRHSESVLKIVSRVNMERRVQFLDRDRTRETLRPAAPIRFFSRPANVNIVQRMSSPSLSFNTIRHALQNVDAARQVITREASVGPGWRDVRSPADVHPRTFMQRSVMWERLSGFPVVVPSDNSSIFVHSVSSAVQRAGQWSWLLASARPDGVTWTGERRSGTGAAAVATRTALVERIYSSNIIRRRLGQSPTNGLHDPGTQRVWPRTWPVTPEIVTRDPGAVAQTFNRPAWTSVPRTLSSEPPSGRRAELRWGQATTSMSPDRGSNATLRPGKSKSVWAFNESLAWPSETVFRRRETGAWRALNDLRNDFADIERHVRTDAGHVAQANTLSTPGTGDVRGRQAWGRHDMQSWTRHIDLALETVLRHSVSVVPDGGAGAISPSGMGQAWARTFLGAVVATPWSTDVLRPASSLALVRSGSVSTTVGYTVTARQHQFISRHVAAPAGAGPILRTVREPSVSPENRRRFGSIVDGGVTVRTSTSIGRVAQFIQKDEQARVAAGYQSTWHRLYGLGIIRPETRTSFIFRSLATRRSVRSDVIVMSLERVIRQTLQTVSHLGTTLREELRQQLQHLAQNQHETSERVRSRAPFAGPHRLSSADAGTWVEQVAGTGPAVTHITLRHLLQGSMDNMLHVPWRAALHAGLTRNARRSTVRKETQVEWTGGQPRGQSPRTQSELFGRDARMEAHVSRQRAVQTLLEHRTFRALVEERNVPDRQSIQASAQQVMRMVERIITLPTPSASIRGIGVTHVQSGPSVALRRGTQRNEERNVPDRQSIQASAQQVMRMVERIITLPTPSASIRGIGVTHVHSGPSVALRRGTQRNTIVHVVSHVAPRAEGMNVLQHPAGQPSWTDRASRRILERLTTDTKADSFTQGHANPDQRVRVRQRNPSSVAARSSRGAPMSGPTLVHWLPQHFGHGQFSRSVAHRSRSHFGRNVTQSDTKIRLVMAESGGAAGRAFKSSASSHAVGSAAANRELTDRATMKAVHYVPLSIRGRLAQSSRVGQNFTGPALQGASVAAESWPRSGTLARGSRGTSGPVEPRGSGFQPAVMLNHYVTAVGAGERAQERQAKAAATEDGEDRLTLHRLDNRLESLQTVVRDLKASTPTSPSVPEVQVRPPERVLDFRRSLRRMKSSEVRLLVNLMYREVVDRLRLEQQRRGLKF